MKIDKSKPKFPEPPPSMDVDDPRWAQAFQEWWWRKCKYYGVDPIDAFASMLGEDAFITKKSRDIRPTDLDEPFTV